MLLCERTKGSEIVEDWKGDVINVHEELRFCGGPGRFFEDDMMDFQRGGGQRWRGVILGRATAFGPGPDGR